MTREPVEFLVRGNPAAQGSKTPWGSEANKNLAPWRRLIVEQAALHNAEKFVCPVQVRFVFWFQRPASHYGTGRNAGTLKASAPHYRASAPDVDKLCRAVADALTIAGLILDDRLIVRMEAEKRYGDPGVLVHVREMEPPCSTEGGGTQSPSASSLTMEPTMTGARSMSSTTISAE